jgi:hypothetical protein
MKLEDLCECNADALEKLSDEELDKIVMPYWNVTRPEMAALQPKKEPTRFLTPEEIEKNKKIARAKEVVQMLMKADIK